MSTDSQSPDAAAVRNVFEEMYDALSWTEQQPPDWKRFSAAFSEGACLAASARPANLIDVDTFTKRMATQRDNGSLPHFVEKQIGIEVGIFGNTATAQSAYHTDMGESGEGRGVNSAVLIKDEDRWRVVSMCWDSESEDKPIPSRLSA